eukprot:gene3744-4266_t
MERKIKYQVPIGKKQSFSDVVKEMHADIKRNEDINNNKDSDTFYNDGFFEDDCDSTDSGWDTDLEDDIYEIREHHDNTGKRTYLRSCKEQKIIPSTHVLSCFSKSELSVRHRAIGPKEIKSIAEALICNTYVKVLDLEDNNIGSSGINQILKLFLENCFITDVSLSDNNLGSKGADVFCQILKSTRTLVKVNLSGNRFSDRDCCKIADGLMLNDTVKILSLKHNELMSEAGRAIGQAISRNKILTHLDLSWNHLRMDGAIGLANGLAKNTSIEVLNLSFNGFSDNGAEAISHAVANNTTLEELDLSHNRISEKGAMALGRGLEKNTALKKLNVSYNPISPQGSLALLTAAKEAQELVELLMGEAFLDPKAVEIIQEMLKAKSDLVITYSGIAKDSLVDGPKNDIEFLKKKIFQTMKKYLKDNQMRMIDLFNSFDKDKSLTLTRKEFHVGIDAAKIPLSEKMIEFLVDQLDADKNGVVEYDEFVAIYGIE